MSGAAKAEAARDLCATFHAGTPQEAAQHAAKLLEHGVGAAVDLGRRVRRRVGDADAATGDCRSARPHDRQRHALSLRERRRRRAAKKLLLQACSFTALFRQAAAGRGALKELTIDAVAPQGDAQPGAVKLDDVFADVSRATTMQAAKKLQAYLAGGGSAQAAVDMARRLIFLKGRDSHDYKFSSAVLEDYQHVTPAWRNTFLALSVFNLKGTGDRDNGLVARTRAALA